MIRDLANAVFEDKGELFEELYNSVVSGSGFFFFLASNEIATSLAALSRVVPPGRDVCPLCNLEAKRPALH